MFNPLFRSYLPGFRVGLDGVPGFNIDDNGLPRRANASPDDTLPDAMAQQDPEAAQTQNPSISFSLPGAEGWVLSAPLLGSPGLRVSPRDDAPGFNVGSQDNTPGFNLAESGVPQQETTWSNGPPPGSLTRQDLDAPQTSAEEPAQAALPPLPEWLYQLGTILSPRLPPAFDPRIGNGFEINSQPGIARATAPGADPWPLSSAPQQPPDINIRSRAAMTQNTNPQAAAQQAMGTAWLQPPKGGWPTAQGGGGLPRIPSVQPPAASNFNLANSGDAGEQQARQMPLQDYQQTQRTRSSVPLDTGTMIPLSQEPGRSAKGFEPESEQEFSQLIEAYRRLKEVEGRQPTPDQRSSQPALNETRASSYASASDGPSLGQRLVQNTVETLVPGAYYQQLARQQLGAGNYVGAGVYQAAALLDAVLGVATLGLSTRLAAAGRTAAAEGTALFRRAFDSREQLLRYLGRAPEGMQWHHIVEQSQAAKFGQRRIQTVENIVAIPIEAHQKLNAFYSSKRYFSTPDRVRVWLRRRSFEEQYEYGMERLKQVLGY